MADTLIIAERYFTPSLVDIGWAYDIEPTEIGYLFEFVPGETYKVIFDGKTYTCTANDASAVLAGCTVIGNASSFGLPGNGEPFGMVSEASWGGFSIVCLEDTEPTEHSVTLYKVEKNAVILPEQKFTTIEEPFYGSTVYNGYPVGSGSLTVGGTYTVYFDDNRYVCTGMDVGVMLEGAVAIGNGSAWDMPGNGEPFVIASIADQGIVVMCLEDTAAAEHRIAVYSGEVTISKLILKNPRGNDEEYPMRSRLRLRTSDDLTVIYSKGETVDNVSVTLDFSKGDQTISAGEGYLVKSAVIKKPDELKPENIVKGTVVAGVEGVYEIAGTTTTKVEADFSKGPMVIEAAAGTLMQSATVAAPESLRPENIPEGMFIAGVGPGTFQGIAKDVATETEMNALLVTGNIGKVYRFTGETTESYINGDIYVVEEAEETA